jgi:hypothetical protein
VPSLEQVDVGDGSRTQPINHSSPKGLFNQTRVRPIRFQTEKIRFHERVEHHLAHRRLNPTQALHLFNSQPHAWHFQILGANAFQQL